MSTRARTRSATAALNVPIPQPPPRSRRNQVAAPTESPVAEEGRGIQKHDSEEKENRSKDVADREHGLSAAARNVKRKVQTNGKAKGKGKAVCTCRGQDDGTPMIECSRCGEWYHFTCIQLSESDAEDIRIYICPPCTEKTSERTIMDWEGADAVEEIKPTITIPKRQNKSPQTNGDRKNGAAENNHVAIPSSESEGDADSEDDYVSEAARSRMKGKRRIARQSSSEESDGLSQDERPGRRRLSRQGGSPSLKRKRTTVREPVPKRKKSESEAPAEDDPTRKYCLGKLGELFSKVFHKYPHLHVDGVAVEKPREGLTDDDKRKLEEAAKEFSTGLEQCVFEIYSEPDKDGRPHAGAKYKDRFRTLQFNLGKDDRVVIHKRIASAQITPKEISMMSSTDLANEETKQSIKQLEQEALEHSILQKATVPRAKITHKGFQDIEDENGLLTSTRELERERERQVEEEERIERERLARLRTQRQRTQSMSVPPESPMSATGQSPARWGAPPPLPSRVSSTTSPLDQTPMSASDANLYPLEPELNLADLINIDDDLQVATNEPPPSSAETAVSHSDLHATDPPTVPTTGISPFSPNAPKAETIHQGSFDLNAIWTAPTSTVTDQPSTTPPGSPPAHYSSTYAGAKSTPDSEPVAEDQDFDMLLEEPNPETPAVAYPPPNNLDSLPPVWSGKISMPLDSTIPQETPVVARQVGGRTLVPESPLWKTLFPSDILRIEGRVPVDKSAEYLLQMRMNASKELISAAFSPATEHDTAPLQIISDFLIGKGRHGLIFPWGHRPKDHHPGRELYIIPLLSTEPLPEYIELLDDLKLPKVRNTNCLIGIWILQKGRLAPPNNTFNARPQTMHEGPSTATSLHSPAVPAPPFPLVAPQIVPQIEPAVLAAEVASLTPEQIQMMLRTLTSGSAVPIPLVTDIVPPPAAPPVPPAHWGNNVPTFSQGGGPPPSFPPYNDMRGNHNDRPYGGDRRDPTDRGIRGDRGGRGRSRGRGRARRDDDEFTRRPSDSGWPRRHRGDYRGDDYRKEQWT
ncbi:hypothetical protein BDN71DRAFT_1445288 [Pleurotus eryngii]|uniref:Transcription factor BYE1 n=1 Tax=Pleurotus eryngii TaxID=5323 RepID=A0A9P6D8Q0_PLEER|nr:hypothetical protein BDN71DRAFT_1445288 [Pleurotus eryngii]